MGVEKYVIGVDFGTDSVRAVLIDARNGVELVSDIFWYPRWRDGKYCKPEIGQFRQHPLDHVEGLEHTVRSVVMKGGVSPESIHGICVDTTGSSPLPITEDGVPLALVEGFGENPNAMVLLWKDHTALEEADQINKLAKEWQGGDYTKYVGGMYSPEWFWAKIMHVANTDRDVAQAAHTWMEHCDFMTYLLVDEKDLELFKRSRCAAGHKALWHESWGGLPPEEFLFELNPYLASLRANLYEETYTSNHVAGHLNHDWAKKLGLTSDTVIAVGTFDAHAGAVGAKVDSNILVRVMGTSTCDIMVLPQKNIGDKPVKGICGQVEGSVVPGMVGLEAGQSAFGDVLAWFKNLLEWPTRNMILTSKILSTSQKVKLLEEIENGLIDALTDQGKEIALEEAIPCALDWLNGRRSPGANLALRGAITGLSLGTRAPHLFIALVNAICFGSKKIVDRFEEEGIRIDAVYGVGGVARKSDFIMQTLANVLNRPVKVVASDQTPALGAAIYAAVASGIYNNVLEASKRMGSDYEAEYCPDPTTIIHYEKQMVLYNRLGAFVEMEK